MIRGRRGGFSLIELLTVVGIAAILAASLVPVYLDAKKAAMRGECQSNLRQIARAFEAYTADHDGCYPNTGDPYLWMGRHFRWPIRKYVGFGAAYDPTDDRGARQVTQVSNHVLHCPADPSPRDVWDGTSYGYSAAFYHTPEQINSMTLAQLYNDPDPMCATVRTSAVKHPSKKAIAAEWLSAHSDKQVGWWSWEGARNYLFADGHVVLLAASRIRPAVDSYPDINLTVDGVAGKDID